MPFIIERNDLSVVRADAVVVAANEQLQITGGVGMVVAQAAGLDDLQAACDAIGFCPCGSAVATPAFGLNAKVIVHAVGPVWRGGSQGEADFLRSAYDAALQCAVAEGARSIALPLISAGTYGFPADVSLAVAREAIRSFLNRHDDVDVRLVLYSRESVTAGMDAYLDIAEYIDDHYVHDARMWESMVLNAPSGQAQAARTRPAAADEPRKQGTKRRRGLIARLSETIESVRDKRAESQVGESAEVDRISAPMPDAASAPASEAAFTPMADATFAPMPDAAPAPMPDATFGQMPAAAPAPMPSGGAAYAPPPSAAPAGQKSLDELLASLDAPFSTTLLTLIDERGMTDVQVYKRANMSRQLFSKIRSDAAYRPTKKTVLALAIALGLTLDETRDLLARAGFALSSSSKGDVIVEYFIGRGNYDIFEINEALYAFDQPIL